MHFKFELFLIKKTTDIKYHIVQRLYNYYTSDLKLARIMYMNLLNISKYTHR